MSKFSTAAVERYARANGLDYYEACSRMGRKGAQVAAQKRADAKRQAEKEEAFKRAEKRRRDIHG